MFSFLHSFWPGATSFHEEQKVTSVQEEKNVIDQFVMNNAKLAVFTMLAMLVLEIILAKHSGCKKATASAIQNSNISVLDSICKSESLKKYVIMAY